jgi:uncharacterized membrane protein YkvA (DUF1232 family)
VSALLLALGVAVAIYLAFVLLLVVLGRRDHAVALARFVPDCAVLFRRLMGDERVPRSRKVLLGLLVGYLAMPIDLIPDFIPVAGQLDDAVLVAIVLRSVLSRAGPGLVSEHWPGPPESLNVMLRLAGSP